MFKLHTKKGNGFPSPSCCTCPTFSDQGAIEKKKKKKNTKRVTVKYIVCVAFESFHVVRIFPGT